MVDAKEEHNDDRIGSQLALDMMDVESQKSPPDQDTIGSTDPLGTPLPHEPQGFNWITAEFISLRTRVEHIEKENKFYKSLQWQMHYDIIRLKGYLKERNDEIASIAGVFQELHQRLTRQRAFEDTLLPPVGYERQDLGDFKQTILG
jgi:G3E family GTPase